MLIISSGQPKQLKAYTRTLEMGESLAPMTELLASGQIRSYSQQGNTVTIYSENPAAAQSLPILKKPTFNIKQRAVNFLKPEQMERDCAPEYATWRKWNLASSVLSGVMGFMATSVFLDSQNASYSNSEAVAFSGVLTGSLGKITQMAASPLAKLGDADPKKSYLRSQLLSTGISTAGLGLLAALPTAHLPMFCASSVLGTVSGTIGSAAGANIFSHLVPGSTKGDVVTKDSNQELIASLWGMPAGLALSRVAKSMGWDPGVLAACLLGPLKGFCHLQAARALRMNPAGPELLQQLTKAYVETGELPEAPRDGLWETLKEVFRGTDKPSPRELPFVSNLAQAVGEDPKFTFRLFADENYLLSLDKKGLPKVALRSDARSEDAFRACLHTELVRQAMDSGMPEALTQLGSKSVAQDLIRLTKRALPDKAKSLETLARRGWHLSLRNLHLPTVSGAWSEKEGEACAEPPISLEILRGLFVKTPRREVLARLIAPETSAVE